MEADRTNHRRTNRQDAPLAQLHGRDDGTCHGDSDVFCLRHVRLHWREAWLRKIDDGDPTRFWVYDRLVTV